MSLPPPREPSARQPAAETGGRTFELVPRFKDQGYSQEDVAKRRRWLEQKTGCSLAHVGAPSFASERLRGNVENPVGVVQVPLGIAGPLWVRGEHADGVFYVPMATTEGALIRSYERGMVTLLRSGGVETRILVDENRVDPVFFFDSVAEAADFARRLPDHFETLRLLAESTTRHGRLRRVECHVVGREVIVDFAFFTADAHGMNMIVNAAQNACQWILATFAAARYYIFSGFASEKRASGSLLGGGKGKKVTAGAKVPARIARAFLHADPERVADVWRHTVLGHMQGGALGYNGHLANGLTAIFIACGQDVANVVNAAVGITHFETTEDGDLYASVTLPALTVATVGGGTALPTSRECLELLGCYGDDKAVKLAEIVAATLLAGELSMAAAIGSGELAQAHETYGRNRPDVTS